MLNVEIFSRYFGAMLDRFRMTDSTHVLEETYYEILSKQITDQEFVTAVKRVISEDQFFPSGESIVAKIKGDSSSKALEAWDVIVKAASRGRMPEVNDLALKSLKAIGGIKAVEMADAEQLMRMRKEFVREYQVKTTSSIGASLQPVTAIQPASTARLNGAHS